MLAAKTAITKPFIPTVVKHLQPGDEFEIVPIGAYAGGTYRLLYTVGESRAYVQSLSTRHVKIDPNNEFDAPGVKSNIGVDTPIRLVKRA